MFASGTRPPRTRECVDRSKSFSRTVWTPSTMACLPDAVHSSPWPSQGREPNAEEPQDAVIGPDDAAL